VGFEGSLAAEWHSYVVKLVSNFIKLKEEEEDSLCWSKNMVTWVYTRKLGNATIMEARLFGDKKRQQNIPWKIHAPLKIKLTVWLALTNKLLEWENGLKRGWIGPS
jgi:hypothetical protein